MIILMWPTKHQRFPGFGATIPGSPVKSWSETALGAIRDLMIDAGNEGMSDNS